MFANTASNPRVKTKARVVNNPHRTRMWIYPALVQTRCSRINHPCIPNTTAPSSADPGVLESPEFSTPFPTATIFPFLVMIPSGTAAHPADTGPPPPSHERRNKYPTPRAGPVHSGSSYALSKAWGVGAYIYDEGGGGALVCVLAGAVYDSRSHSHRGRGIWSFYSDAGREDRTAAGSAGTGTGGAIIAAGTADRQKKQTEKEW